MAGVHGRGWADGVRAGRVRALGWGYSRVGWEPRRLGPVLEETWGPAVSAEALAWTPGSRPEVRPGGSTAWGLRPGSAPRFPPRPAGSQPGRPLPCSDQLHLQRLQPRDRSAHRRLQPLPGGRQVSAGARRQPRCEGERLGGRTARGGNPRGRDPLGEGRGAVGDQAALQQERPWGGGAKQAGGGGGLAGCGPGGGASD